MSSNHLPKGVFSNLPELLLVFGTLLALIWRNSDFGGLYDAMLHVPLGISLHHWVNDGLMAIFFFFIGLEVKREIVIGHLSTREKLMLPLLGAIGGMLLPGLIFAGFVLSASSSLDPSAIRGWAIPAATDIAFALGVLRIVGKGLPDSLRIFLAALAIADDLGAILIIAFFYSSGVSVIYLALAGLVLLAAIFLAKKDKLSVQWIVILGVLIWLSVFNSGVHATIAGVALALTVPASKEPQSLMYRLEHALLPFINFLILPIFALFNAGISLAGFTSEALFAPVTLGVTLGLFLGKQFGVWLGAYVIPKLFIRGAGLPSGVSRRQFYGVSILTGIGFTMSLFIAALAYPADSLFSVQARIGVLLGSILSIIFGAIVLNPIRKADRLAES